jgi:hypothetical protein
LPSGRRKRTRLARDQANDANGPPPLASRRDELIGEISSNFENGLSFMDRFLRVSRVGSSCSEHSESHPVGRDPHVILADAHTIAAAPAVVVKSPSHPSLRRLLGYGQDLRTGSERRCRPACVPSQPKLAGYRSTLRARYTTARPAGRAILVSRPRRTFRPSHYPSPRRGGGLVRLVLFTAGPDARQLARGLQADGVIGKPYDLEELATKLREPSERK